MATYVLFLLHRNKKSLHFLKQGLHYVYVAAQQNSVNVNFATFLFAVLFFQFSLEYSPC